jgi:hypothetical protein
MIHALEAASDRREHKIRVLVDTARAEEIKHHIAHVICTDVHPGRWQETWRLPGILEHRLTGQHSSNSPYRAKTRATDVMRAISTGYRIRLGGFAELSGRAQQHHLKELQFRDAAVFRRLFRCRRFTAGPGVANISAVAH